MAIKVLVRKRPAVVLAYLALDIYDFIRYPHYQLQYLKKRIQHAKNHIFSQSHNQPD